MDRADREQRMVRIERDLNRRAYPPPRDPSQPLVMGPGFGMPKLDIIVMRPDAVALAETLKELREAVKKLHATVRVAQEEFKGVADHGWPKSWGGRGTRDEQLADTLAETEHLIK